MPYNPNYKISLELYLVRHGLSAANAGVQGDTIEENQDPHLAEKGTRQAQLLAGKFAAYPLDCIMSSCLYRAIETALPVADSQPENGAKAISVHPLFGEVGISTEYSGKTSAQLQELYPSIVMADGTENYEYLLCHTTDGQTSKARAKEAIEYLTSHFHNGEKVMLVSHGGFIRYLMEAALNIDFEPAMSDPSFFNTGVTKIIFFQHGEGIYGNDVVLVYMNEHSHLLGEDETISFTKI